jgi:hypothetical protein
MSSIAIFTRKSLSLFSTSKKDVMYDLLKREEINWRELNLQTSKAVYKQNGVKDKQLFSWFIHATESNRKMSVVRGWSANATMILSLAPFLSAGKCHCGTDHSDFGR